MIGPARWQAFKVLLQLEQQADADVGSLVASARRALRDTRDQALLTELVAGTLRMRAAVDFQLQPRLTRPLTALDPAVRTALRLGGFQLVALTRTPASAIVNDAVAQVKGAGTRSAAGLVNAVLRRLALERDRLAWPEGDDAGALATRYSHPEWLVRRWLARHGVAATRAWLAFNNHSPRLCLAANRWRGTRDALAARLARDGVVTVPTTHAADGLVVQQGQPLSGDAFREGWFVVQDEASQLIAALVSDAGTTARMLDLCAAPGGKTLGLSWRAGATGSVVACDVRPRRLRVLQRTIARLGLARVWVVHAPPAGPLPFREGAFDRVLVDAPCSGLGTLRRDPDIRWRREEADLERFAAAQLQLIDRAAATVAGGGALVYSTCSSEPDENEHVVRAFLSQQPAFALVQEHHSWPFVHGLEAFYGAVLVRHL